MSEQKKRNGWLHWNNRANPHPVTSNPPEAETCDPNSNEKARNHSGFVSGSNRVRTCDPLLVRQVL
jgi:hypothetical protein